MEKLIKKLLRDMLAAKGQFISIILIIATGVGFFAGLFTMSESLTKNVNAFYAETNLADIWAYYGGIDQAGLGRLQGIDGVTGVEGRVKVEALSSDADDAKTYFVYTLPEDATINKPYLTQGTLPKDATQCLLCEPTAKADGLAVGDTLGVTIAGVPYTFTISGLFLSPEYVFQVKDASVAVPDYTHFGVVFVSQAMLSQLTGGTMEYNEVSITVQEGTDANDVITALAQATGDYHYAYALTRNKQTSYSIIDYKIGSISKVAKVFPVLFFVVAAALIFISMSRMVASQRGQIGIMKALGKTTGTITWHYISFAIVAGLIGGVFGALIGATVLPWFILGIITQFFTMPPVVLYGAPLYAAIGAVLSIIIGSFATFLSCRLILKESAAQLMRPKPPKNAKKIWLEKRTGLWKQLSYKTKLILRNLFLNTRRTVLGSVGVICGCALILASFAIQGTFSFCMDDYLNNGNNFDYQVVLEQPSDSFEGTLGSYSSVESVSATAKLSAVLALSSEEVETTLTALPASTDAIRLFSADGERMYLPASGVLVSEKLAGAHGVGVGDDITVRIMGAGGATEVKVQVAGIFRSFFGQGLYASFDALAKLGVPPAIASYYLSTSSDADMAAIKDLPGVKAVYTKQDTEDSLASAQSLIFTVILIMIIASAILTLTVIFNITSINIYDRRRDIATLRVLGYHHKEVSRLILIENLIITAFGAIVGTALGFAMQYALIGFIGTADTDFPFMVVGYSVPLAIGAVFLFTIIANFLSKGKIKHIDMVESLKSVE